MNPKKTISVTEARKRIFEIVEDVQKPDTYYTLTENGKPKAVILSYEQFDELLDDLEIYSDPNLANDIKEAEEQIAAGEYVLWEDLKKELGFAPREDLLAVREKAKQKYSAKKKPRKK